MADDAPRSVHFVAIGGTGMGSLAGLQRELGDLLRRERSAMLEILVAEVLQALHRTFSKASISTRS